MGARISTASTLEARRASAKSDYFGAAEATLASIGIRFRKRENVIRAEYDTFAVVVSIDEESKLSRFMVAECDPEHKVPPATRAAVHSAMTRINFEKLQIGKFTMDPDNGRVLFCASIMYRHLSLLEFAHQVVKVFKACVATWRKEFPPLKRIGDGAATVTDLPSRSAQLVEGYFDSKKWRREVGRGVAPEHAGESAWEFVLNMSDHHGGTIVMTVTVRDRLPRSVRIKVVFTAGLKLGAVNNVTGMSRVCEFISTVNFGLEMGAFKMSPSDPSVLRYEALLHFCDDQSEVLVDYLDGLFQPCLNTMVKYLPGARRCAQTGHTRDELAKCDPRRAARGAGGGRAADRAAGRGRAAALEALLKMFSEGGDPTLARALAEAAGLDPNALAAVAAAGPAAVAAAIAAVGGGRARADEAVGGAGAAGAGAADAASGAESDVILLDSKEIEYEEPRRPFAKGGFGAVYKATFCGAPVAVKEATGRFAARTRRAFRAEAAMLGRLSHPNIIRIMGLVLTDTHCAIVMEYANGGSLSHYIDNADTVIPRPIKDKLAKDTLSGMLYLHSRSTPVLHLDMKPANVLLTDGPRAKVADFGLARMRASAASHSTDGSAHGCGTMLYADPLQFTAVRATEALDVWSLGMTLYYLYAEEDPFEDQPHLRLAGLEGFSAAVRLGARPRFPRGFPPAIKPIIESCWKAASARPTVKQLTTQLRAVMSR